MATVPVYLEPGSRKVFACSLEWPGWCRSGRTDEDALVALAAYADRYAPVAAAAGARFPRSVTPEVVERVRGSAATDFGVPGTPAEADGAPLTTAAARRQAALLEASWAALADAAARAPASLRKGPRGGGRDRDAIVAHVAASEFGYARKIGVRHKAPADPGADPDAVAALRAEVLAALRSARSGQPAHDKGWPPRYAARRFAWHVLDHAWEIEDRATLE